jgi:hypothetical protein
MVHHSILLCLQTDLIALHNRNCWSESGINVAYERIVHYIISSKHRAEYIAILHILLLILTLNKINLLLQKNAIKNFVKSATIVPVISIIIRYG